jgi:hypothetical protein
LVLHSAGDRNSHPNIPGKEFLGRVHPISNNEGGYFAELVTIFDEHKLKQNFEPG